VLSVGAIEAGVGKARKEARSLSSGLLVLARVAHMPARNVTMGRSPELNGPKLGGRKRGSR
jgi:hypothetical protein